MPSIAHRSGRAPLWPALRQPVARRRLAAALALGLGLLTTGISVTTPASARTLRYRLQPGQDLPAETIAPAVVAQNAPAAATGAMLGGGIVPRAAQPAPAVASTPIQHPPAPRDPVPSMRADGSEPSSHRAAAAAARAARALADEDGSQFEGNAPAQTELVVNDEPTQSSTVAQTVQGQPVTTTDQRRTSAAVAPTRPAVTCVAGCY